MSKGRGSSETLSASMKLFEVFGCLYDEVIRQGGHERDIFRLCGDQKRLKDVVHCLLGKPSVVETGEASDGPFPVSVDYDLSLRERIAGGCYDWTNSGFEHSTFVPAGRGKAMHSLGFVQFSDYVGAERAVMAIESAGDRPASPEDLLAFGATHPDIQRSCRVVAVGMAVDVNGERFFPGLWGSAKSRILQLHRTSEDWAPKTRFLAIKNMR
jgi:hypothetical protein